MEKQLPRPLRTGDTIALVVPGSPVRRERIQRAAAELELLGYHVKTYGDIYRSYGYLAGEDATRAAELMAAFADPEVTAIFPARGGTGVTRLLDKLDYEVIGKNPKIFAGFSDNTALHSALQNKTGLVTFHSPHPSDGLGATKGMSDLTARTFWRALAAEKYADQNGFEVPLTDAQRDKTVTMVPGKARGRLLGGNLALLGAVMGTPYEVDTTDAILLLEDVHEQPYRIDRLLSQLQLAGKLDELVGVILGQFTKCDASEDEESLTIDQVFTHYFGNLGIPVLANYPTGHSRDNATLPLNVEVEIDADHGRVTVLENPIAV